MCAFIDMLYYLPLHESLVVIKNLAKSSKLMMIPSFMRQKYSISISLTLFMAGYTQIGDETGNFRGSN